MLKRSQLPHTDGFQGRGFKCSVREGGSGCVISSCTILRLVGIKVKFQTSSTWFQPVQGLCACGQQFSSGGSLLHIKTTQECVSGLYLYLSGNCVFSDSMWQICSLSCYQCSSPTAILDFYIFTFPNCKLLSQPFQTQQRPGRLKPFTSKVRDTGVCIRLQFSLFFDTQH